MNLEKLFDKQRELDERIVKEKGLEGQDLLPKKILALQVELGELANEARFFKFWSEDQEPRIKQWNECPKCEGEGWIRQEYICAECDGGFVPSYPLLEEYVDCLHFILSIGIEKGYEQNKVLHLYGKSLTETFNYIFNKVGDFNNFRTRGNYEQMFDAFTGLGEMLGFTWEQIESAYYSKNEVNHQRQESGY